MTINETITLNERDITERFVRAAGPLGQNARGEATAVELRLDLFTSSLPQDVKDRLVMLAGKAVTNDGVLVVVGRASRSQVENRAAARQHLTDLLQRAAALEKPRRPTRVRRSIRDERLSEKKRHGAAKAQRAGRGDE